MRNYIKECGVLLLNKDFEKFLIIYQNESLKWGLPKGYLESHEMINKKYFDCAKRELFEETGIMINTHKYRKIGTFLLRDKLFYVIRLIKDIPIYRPFDKEEVGCVKWLPITDLLEFLENSSCNITLREMYHYILTIYESRYSLANEQEVKPHCLRT